MSVGAEEAPRNHRPVPPPIAVCARSQPPAGYRGGGTGVGAMLSRVPPPSPRHLTDAWLRLCPFVHPSIRLSSGLGGVRAGVKVEGVRGGVQVGG